MRLADGAPFVLVDDQRAGGRQILYRDPSAIVTADDPAQVVPALAALRAAVRAGRHAAGWIGYAAGLAIEPHAAAHRGALPLLWFGLFDRAEPLAPGAIDTLLPDQSGAWLGPPTIAADPTRYAAAFAQVAAYIAAGDIYQANLSIRGRVPLLGDPRAAYRRLRAAAQAPHGALIYDGARWVLSCSPELFFRIDGDRLLARPMKGTAPRGATPAEDAAHAAALAADPKERAENLMIVDLLRNDLARVAVPGSVRVPELFAVAAFPTVLQMTSDVTATLAPGRDAIDALTALFPCGSITGAPKVRAMQIIAEVEDSPRDLYTGAIGTLAPGGDAWFNVAIRTLTLPEGAGEAGFGLGSAVVADALAEREWRECLLKAAFVSAGAPALGLIETMRFVPGAGLWQRARHLARLARSAAALGLAYDPVRVAAALDAELDGIAAAQRVRLHLDAAGAIAVTRAPLPPMPDDATVAIVALPVDPADPRLAHKTDDRAFYDRARAQAGRFDVLFARPDGWLTEGSFTNLFVRRGDRLVTPPATRGLLPGILRETLLASGAAVEGDLAAADLAGEVYVGNALRGLVPVRLG